LLSYLTRRLLLAPITILGLIAVIFVLVRLMPGDPAVTMLGDYATEERVAALRAEMGLDKPWPVQFGVYIGHLLRGNLGESMRMQKEVSWLIGSFFPPTLILALSAMTIAVLVGVSSGIVAAFFHNTKFDYGTTMLAITAYSAPAFWLGLMALFVFGIKLRWFPITGSGSGGTAVDVLRHLVLPAGALGLRQAALVSRMTRTSVLQTLQEDYVRTATAKGLRNSRVLVKHALRNALIPIVTVMGLTLGVLLGGTVVTEVVFSRPGLGKLLVTSVTTRDFQTLQGLVVVWGGIVILINLVIDLVYCWIDPRIRYR
jgi:ABC-type dipeptide/oligopeptide/nickel transport system permease component